MEKFVLHSPLLLLTLTCLTLTQAQYFDVFQGLEQLFQPFQQPPAYIYNDNDRFTSTNRQTHRHENKKKTEVQDRQTKKPPLHQYEYVFATTTPKTTRKTTKPHSSHSNSKPSNIRKIDADIVFKDFDTPTFETTSKRNRVTPNNRVRPTPARPITRATTENVFQRGIFDNSYNRPVQEMNHRNINTDIIFRDDDDSLSIQTTTRRNTVTYRSKTTTARPINQATEGYDRRMFDNIASNDYNKPVTENYYKMDTTETHLQDYQNNRKIGSNVEYNNQHRVTANNWHPNTHNVNNNNNQNNRNPNNDYNNNDNDEKPKNTRNPNVSGISPHNRNSNVGPITSSFINTGSQNRENNNFGSPNRQNNNFYNNNGFPNRETNNFGNNNGSPNKENNNFGNNNGSPNRENNNFGHNNGSPNRENNNFGNNNGSPNRENNNFGNNNGSPNRETNNFGNSNGFPNRETNNFGNNNDSPNRETNNFSNNNGSPNRENNNFGNNNGSPNRENNNFGNINGSPNRENNNFGNNNGSPNRENNNFGNNNGSPNRENNNFGNNNGSPNRENNNFGNNNGSPNRENNNFGNNNANRSPNNRVPSNNFDNSNSNQGVLNTDYDNESNDKIYNPYPNHPGIKPLPIDVNKPPITNRPVTQTPFDGGFGVNTEPMDVTPEIIIGPDESDMTQGQKRRYIDMAEKMCENYKSLNFKEIVALPLLPSPEPVQVNVSSCVPITAPLVIGGRIATINEFPHMVLVGWKKIRGTGYAWKCGGSLISDQYVLTAGHCTYQDKDYDVESGPPQAVQLGSSYLDDPNALIVKISAVIRHPKYKQRRSYYDVALIKLVQTVKFSEVIRPACLGVPPAVGRTIIATGWGRTEFGGDHSIELRSVSLPVWNMEECREIWGTSLKLPNGPSVDSHLCAGERAGGRDTCQGDSGGPAQIQDGCVWRVVAVTSYGRSCGAPNTPALYAITQRVFIAAQVFGEEDQGYDHQDTQAFDSRREPVSYDRQTEYSRDSIYNGHSFRRQ